MVLVTLHFPSTFLPRTAPPALQEYLLRTKFGFGENILLMVDNHTDPLRRPTRLVRLWQQ